MKQYRDYATKTCEIKIEEDTAEITTEPERPPSTTDNEPDSGLPTSYTVVWGDCLWNIAKKYYGDGSKYPIIQSANFDVIAKHGSNPNMIWPGDVLTIPATP